MLTYKNTNLFTSGLLLLLVVFSFFIEVKWWWFLVILVIRFVVLVIGSFRISSNFHLQAICHNPLETEKKIALTFDDGPNEMTLPILEILKKHQVKATFFCIGKNIENHPQILKQIVAEGHTIGNHSYSHTQLFDFYRKNRVIEEIQKTDELIQNYTQKKPLLFRPPYGVTNPSIRQAIAVTKHKVIGWNIRSLDGILKDEKIIFDRIKNRIAPGGIILLHDTAHSVNILQQLLQHLEQNQYKVLPIEDLLKIKVYEN